MATRISAGIPRAIFIDPPFAAVGMTEKEAVAAGNPAKLSCCAE